MTGVSGLCEACCCCCCCGGGSLSLSRRVAVHHFNSFGDLVLPCATSGCFAASAVFFGLGPVRAETGHWHHMRK